jgi:SNF2 family DNA or RNA helicase
MGDDLTDWVKTVPYAHQKKVLEESWEAISYALLLEMGTGKSKILLDTIALLYASGRITGALIVAPKGVVGNWIDGQIPAHLCDKIPRTVLLWGAEQTKINVQAQARLTSCPGLAVLAMNVEALATVRGQEYAARFLRARPCLMAIDESTTVKNPSAQRTRAAIKLGRLAAYRRIMSGTPVTRSPLDLYSQAQFLAPGLLDHSSFFSFRNRYAILRQRRMGTRSFAEITGYHRLDELRAKIERWSSRVMKSDCLDLPAKVYVTRAVELSAEQRRAYDQMRRDSVALLASGDVASATVVITQILRLHQICCGHLPVEGGGVVALPHHRLDELMHILDETSGRVIIWATYRHDIHAIEAAIASVYGREAVVSYFGDTGEEARSFARDAFQDPASPVRYFVGQPRTGGYGLTLTAASAVIYYSNSFDLEIRLQSEDRAHRIGQTQSVTYIDLMARGTVDERIVEALRAKLSLAGQVLGDGWREWLV